MHGEASLDEQEERVEADHRDEAQHNGREDDATVVEPAETSGRCQQPAQHRPSAQRSSRLAEEQDADRKSVV